MFDLQIDKRKRKNTNLSYMNNDCEKTTAHSQNILHGDNLYYIKRKKYKTICAEVTFHIMVMIFFYRICIIFFIIYAVGLL